MNTGFDRIAKYYDCLAFLVFGNQIRKSQLVYLDQIPKNANVLILGGGTGWILNSIFNLADSDRITYVESSKQMINISKRNVSDQYLPRIKFVLDREFVNVPTVYDVIVTNYFFDLFTIDTMLSKMKSLYTYLRPGGLWICTDFIQKPSGSLYNRILLKIMYAFFRATCHIEARELTDIFGAFFKYNLSPIKSTYFHFKNIKTVLYRREVA